MDNLILIGKDIQKIILDELAKSVGTVVIISAYCKKFIVEKFDSVISNKVANKKLVVRLRLEDVISGASDLELYEYCKKNGWEMYFNLDLHAKIYIFDNIRCFIGSANATAKGLSFSEHSNIEGGTIIDLIESDMSKVHTLIDESILINDDIYIMLCNEKNRAIKEGNEKFDWSKQIKELFDNEVGALFSFDFPPVNKPESGKYYEFLHEVFVSSEKSSSVFKKTRVYRWLKHVINARENREIYFGDLSSELHNSIIADPPLYRREVKELLQNLLGWLSVMDVSVKVDQPNYSQRIKLL